MQHRRAWLQGAEPQQRGKSCRRNGQDGARAQPRVAFPLVSVLGGPFALLPELDEKQMLTKKC